MSIFLNFVLCLYIKDSRVFEIVQKNPSPLLRTSAVSDVTDIGAIASPRCKRLKLTSGHGFEPIDCTCGVPIYFNNTSLMQQLALKLMIQSRELQTRFA